VKSFIVTTAAIVAAVIAYMPVVIPAVLPYEPYAGNLAAAAVWLFLLGRLCFCVMAASIDDAYDRNTAVRLASHGDFRRGFNYGQIGLLALVLVAAGCWWMGLLAVLTGLMMAVAYHTSDEYAARLDAVEAEMFGDRQKTPPKQKPFFREHGGYSPSHAGSGQHPPTGSGTGFRAPDFEPRYVRPAAKSA